MNFQTTPILEPLKVVMINPLAPAAQLLAVKILSGKAFGHNQLINLTLLVYSNEKPLAEAFKTELIKCAFSDANAIEVSSDLPRITDYDVFCFITNFKNPNYFELGNIDVDDDQFDTLYLLIKVANNLKGPLQKIEKTNEKKVKSNKRNTEEEKKLRKPIFIADGLVAIGILKTLSKDVPSELFFCSSPLPTIAKTVLADYLKVHCNVINDVFVWAVNDVALHVEIEKPIIIDDRRSDSLDNKQCNFTMVGSDLLDSINLDHTQFSPSWMKKEFIDKVISTAKSNPYGCIYKANEFLKTIQKIWSARTSHCDSTVYTSLGVISDGSLGTIAGLPYVLPVDMRGESWNVNKRFQDDIHLIAEIKRINEDVKEYHSKMMLYCKRFLEENVINKMFMISEESIDSNV